MSDVENAVHEALSASCDADDAATEVSLFLASLTEQGYRIVATVVPPSSVTVHFEGGPWAGQTADIDHVTAPLFAVGHDIGGHYWLDTKSDPPTYFWDES